MTTRHLIAIAAVTTMLIGLHAANAAPGTVVYSGYLMDGSQPIDLTDDAPTMTFELYDSDGVLLWNQTLLVDVEADGQFFALLDLLAPDLLPLGAEALFAADEWWLAVILHTNGEDHRFDELQRIPAFPVAVTSGDSDRLQGYSPEELMTTQWGDITDRPDGLDDGDDDTLALLECGQGQVAKWNAGVWGCAQDQERDRDALAALDCEEGQVPKWNGELWECAMDGTGGAITAVDTAAGLTSSVANGVVSVEVDFGPGANQAAPGTHNHDEVYRREDGRVLWSDLDPNTIPAPALLPQGQTTGLIAVNNRAVVQAACEQNKILKFSNGAWVCGDDQVSDIENPGDITSVTAGQGLRGGGDAGPVELRVNFGEAGLEDTVARFGHDHAGAYALASQSCGVGRVIEGFEPDGTPICAENASEHTELAQRLAQLEREVQTLREHRIDEDLVLEVVPVPGPGQYSSVATALAYLDDKAVVGNAVITIRVAPGNYAHGEALEIRHGDSDRIRITGSPGQPEQVVLQFDDSAGLVLADGARLGLVNGLTLQGNRDRSLHSGVLVSNGAYLHLGASMVIRSFPGRGIHAGNGGIVIVSRQSEDPDGAHLIVENNGGTGVEAETSAIISARWAELRGNGHHGALATNNAIVHLGDAQIVGNGPPGVDGQFDGANVVSAQMLLHNATVSGNGRFGVAAASNSMVSVYQAEITANRYSGLLSGTDSMIEAEGATVVDNDTAKVDEEARIDVLASNQSFVHAVRATAGVLQPVPNRLGLSGALVLTDSDALAPSQEEEDLRVSAQGLGAASICRQIQADPNNTNDAVRVAIGETGTEACDRRFPGIPCFATVFSHSSGVRSSGHVELNTGLADCDFRQDDPNEYMWACCSR